MNLAALRSRVRALRRKLVLARAQVILYRMAEEECLEWARAQDQGKTPPKPHDFVQRVVKAGFRLPSFTGVISYLTRCRPKDQPPDTVQLYKTLIPWPTPTPCHPDQAQLPTGPPVLPALSRNPEFPIFAYSGHPDQAQSVCPEPVEGSW